MIYLKVQGQNAKKMHYCSTDFCSNVIVIYAKLPWTICLTASFVDECHVGTHFWLLLLLVLQLKEEVRVMGHWAKENLLMCSLQTDCLETFDEKRRHRWPLCDEIWPEGSFLWWWCFNYPTDGERTERVHWGNWQTTRHRHLAVVVLLVAVSLRGTLL